MSSNKNNLMGGVLFLLYLCFSVEAVCPCSRRKGTLRVPDSTTDTKRQLLDSEDDNTIFTEVADEDGFFIGEVACPESRVYVYFSERERIIDLIRRV